MILKVKIVRFLQGFNGILEKIDKIKEFWEKAWENLIDHRKKSTIRATLRELKRVSC